MYTYMSVLVYTYVTVCLCTCYTCKIFLVQALSYDAFLPTLSCIIILLLDVV